MRQTSITSYITKDKKGNRKNYRNPPLTNGVPSFASANNTRDSKGICTTKISYVDHLQCDESLEEVPWWLPAPYMVTADDIGQITVPVSNNQLVQNITDHAFRLVIRKLNSFGGETLVVVSRDPRNPNKFAILKAMKDKKGIIGRRDVEQMTFREGYFGSMFCNDNCFSGVIGSGKILETDQMILVSELVTYCENGSPSRPAQTLRTAFGGETNKEYLPIGPFITTTRKVHFKTIARQLVHRLHVMFRKRVCHRDIRPANLLLQYYRAPGDATSFSSGRVVVIDFGSAVSLDPANVMYDDCLVYGNYLTMPIQALMIHSEQATKGIHAHQQHFRECSDAWGAGVTLAVLFGQEESHQVDDQSKYYMDMFGQEKALCKSGPVFHSNMKNTETDAGNLIDDLRTWMISRHSDAVYPDVLVTEWTDKLTLDPAHRNLINALLLCSNRIPVADDKECYSPRTEGFWNRMYALADQC